METLDFREYFMASLAIIFAVFRMIRLHEKRLLSKICKRSFVFLLEARQGIDGPLS